MTVFMVQVGSAIIDLWNGPSRWVNIFRSKCSISDANSAMAGNASVDLPPPGDNPRSAIYRWRSGFRQNSDHRLGQEKVWKSTEKTFPHFPQTMLGTALGGTTGC